MKKIITFCVLLFALLNFSFCSSNPGEPVMKPQIILHTDAGFVSYISKTLSMLTQHFIAYDANGKEISKMEFLKQVSTGRYLYLWLNSTDNKTYFKLYELHGANELKSGSIISAYVNPIYVDYQWVGKPFPKFDITDINGIRYNNENTKGKIVVLKCWFIGCGACVKEMPELNKLVHQYKKRKDILFISIAPDSTNKIKAFFTKTRFDYANAGNQHNLIYNDLKTMKFPTHFIINKQGTIVNVVDEPGEIDYSLKNNL